MKQVLQLLRWDLLLLQRYQLISISLGIAAVYMGIFYMLRTLGDLENVLIVMIFNDPVITGYLFGGVLVLYEKNQHTLEALSVSPIQFVHYLWSRGLALMLISTLTALLMVWVAHGIQLQYLHFVVGVAGSTLLFAWTGCIVGARARSFNHFLMYTIGILIPVSLPFVTLFGIGPAYLACLFPSYPGILLLKAAFQPLVPWEYIYSYGYLPVCLTAVFWWSRKTFEHQ